MLQRVTLQNENIFVYAAVKGSHVESCVWCNYPPLNYRRSNSWEEWQYLSLGSIPKFLQSYVVYQFTCAGCNACYIGKTKSHLKTRIEEHLGNDNNSQILKHLQENTHCRQVSNFDRFDVIDRDTFHFRFQLKKAIHITWKKPILNKQIKHVIQIISV